MVCSPVYVTCPDRIGKSIRTRSRLEVARGRCREGGERLLTGAGVGMGDLSGSDNVLKLRRGDGVTGCYTGNGWSGRRLNDLFTELWFLKELP